MFQPDSGTWTNATFRIQVFTAPGLRPVGIATQIPGQDGRSLTNAAEIYAAAVWERLCPEEAQPPIWIENQLLQSTAEPRLKVVRFGHAEPFRLTDPSWETIDPPRLSQLVGCEVDLTRGDGYIPPPPEPEPIEVFIAFPVQQLPLTTPFRAACMVEPSRRSWPGQFQFLSRRRGAIGRRTCCFYHQIDWVQVNKVGIPVLKKAWGEGLRGEELITEVEDRAAGLLSDQGSRDALGTLLHDPIHIVRDGEGWAWINGQHRTQAMKDLGIPLTIVMIYEWPEADELPDLR